MSTQATTLPPLPDWSMRDDLGGLVPSDIRSELKAYARAAIAAQAQKAPSDASAAFNDYRDSMRKLGEPSEFQFWCAGAKWGQAQQPAAVKESLTLEQVEAVADVDDAAYALLAILQRVGPGATVGQVLSILEQAQQAQGVPADFEQIVQALEAAKNGLLWYQDRCKDAVDGSDDEAMEEIDRAIETCHQLAAAPQAEQDK